MNVTAEGSRLDAAISRVVEAGNCSGCGVCQLLDDGLTMQLDAAGFARPVRSAASTAGPHAAEQFARSCPGRIVSAAAPPGSVRHPSLGPITGAWRAWASDPVIRHAGSSGGTLTALSAWLLESGRSSTVLGAASSQADARRTVSVSITTREEALAAAGSRYAPVLSGAPFDSSATIVGQPCRAAALRALGDAPLLLSFFCAGTPSQQVTDRLALQLGGERVRSLRYRGNGWPGRFSVTRENSTIGSLSYEESWGEHLGRDLQWRCKICPDGVGESADIVAADLWESDEQGYPRFTDGDGVSALIARTARGYEVVVAAIAAGVLEARPLDLERLTAAQPLQVGRRQSLLGRLIGARLAGARLPRYRGFGLLALALPRWRENLRMARGTFRRRRAARL